MKKLKELFTIDDIISAYRKSKIDDYHSNNPNHSDFYKFERKDFLEKLSEILLRLNNLSFKTYSETFEFFRNNLGYSYATIKKVDNDKTTLRLLFKPSVCFYILSSLWIDRIGIILEKEMSSSVYSSKINRDNDNGSFLQYKKRYQKWRDDAINCIKTEINNGNDVTLLSTDICDYFYSVSLMKIRKTIEKKIQGLKRGLYLLNDLLFDLIVYATEGYRNDGNSFLPVGLPASEVLANFALIDLDCIIKEEIKPKYYGRYVDDILIVKDCCAGLKELVLSNKSVNHFFEESGLSKNEDKTKENVFEANDIGNNKIEYIRSIINSTSSEWKSVPDIPNNIPLRFLHYDFAETGKISSFDGNQASVSKIEISFILRDMEALAKILSPEDWESQRHRFFDAIITYCLKMKENIGTFFQYFYRVLSLSALCDEANYLKEMLKIVLSNTKNCVLFDGSKTNNIAVKSLFEIFIDDITVSIRKCVNPFIKISFSMDSGKVSVKRTETIISKSFCNYILHDLSYFPLKNCVDNYFTPLQLYPQLYGCILNNADFKELRIKDHNTICIKGRLEEADIKDAYGDLDIQKLFNLSTRPLYLSDIPIDIDFLLNYKESIPKKYESIIQIDGDSICVDSIDNDLLDSYSVALTSMSIDEAIIDNYLRGNRQSMYEYFERICRIINVVLASKEKIDYLVFPELAIPFEWFSYFAFKLKRKNTSFISGVFYIIDNESKTITNEVRMSFVNKTTNIILRQRKQLPAHDEREMLENDLGYSFRVPKLNKWPPIIRHGDFFFCVLICAEFSNIQFRSSVEGKVDAIIIPEWNKDIKSFDSYICSSALDNHCFVIQCNNNCYGDSRIRVPYQKDYLRDVCRVSGGENDYIVISKLNVKDLRNFQNHYYPPDEPFKPFPIGFKMSKERKERLQSGVIKLKKK